MKLIENYNILSKLIFSHFKKNLVTNCFLSKEEWELEIQAKKAYYFEIEKNLFLFRNRDEFWILNYYLNDISTAKTELEKYNSKPIVVEIVSKNISDETYHKQQELFNQLGWNKKLERERFEKTETLENLNQLETVSERENFENVKKENVMQQASLKNIEEKLKVLVARNEDVEKILELLRDSFNPYYGCIPTKQKLEDDISKNFVYIAKKEENIIGVLHFNNNDKMAEIRHLAVDKDWRGQGIANELMNVYENEIKVSKKIVWTGAENQVAQGVYKKYGYQKDGYVSSVYMNEK